MQDILKKLNEIFQATGVPPLPLVLIPFTIGTIGTILLVVYGLYSYIYLPWLSMQLISVVYWYMYPTRIRKLHQCIRVWNKTEGQMRGRSIYFGIENKVLWRGQRTQEEAKF